VSKSNGCVVASGADGTFPGRPNTSVSSVAMSD
jgi:hypothetical protein